MFHQQGREEFGGCDDEGGEAKEEVESVPEYFSGVGVVPFSVSSSDDDLGSYAESESCHEEYHVVYYGDGGRTEFDLTDSSEEGCVSETDHLFHYKAYQDGISYFPDVAVGVFA